MNHCEASALREPYDADRVSDGKYAAFATPICALAAATRRSAAATSGRRSSSSEGKPIGTRGIAAASGAAAIENSAGALPMRTAIACSSCARCTPVSIAWA